jgi:RNA polymerase sigma factor (sigma-70 family)
MRQNPEDDLGQVLRSVAKGDRAAFRLLYEQAGPTLFGICSRILRDRNAAEDAFQEAMLRIWQKSYLYDPAKGGAMNWMVTLVRRVALDRLPARRTGPVSLTDESVAALVEALSHQAARSNPRAGPAKVPEPPGTKLPAIRPFGLLLRPEIRGAGRAFGRSCWNDQDLDSPCC